jgi:acid phosphatase (class A)
VARAHRDTRFDDDIRAARAEYAQLKGVSVAETFPIGEAIDVPYGERFLPDPVDTASARYMADLMLYWSNKPIRYTERGDTARDEAEYSVNMMQKVMGEAMETNLSDEGTPAITALLAYVLEKASDTADRLKPLRFRKRPFVQLGEPSFVAGDEEKERGKSSFPSGHTNLGWSTALVMAEVAPDHQDEILRRGYEYGHNRLIVGYHWYTDIEATRQLAAGLVARLHADPTFRQLMADARTEYESITTSINSQPIDQWNARTVNGTVYRLDGIPATETTRGIVIEDGQKRIRQ